MTDILLLAHESDFALDRVVSWLRQESPELEVVRVNREQFNTLGMYSATLGSSSWQIDNVPSVIWMRQLLPERDPYGPAPSAREIDDILVQRRQWLAWSQLFNSKDVRWLNNPLDAQVAESKIQQLVMAANCGISVPQTLVTNNRNQAQSFSSKYGPCVVKSIATAFWEFSDQSFVFTTAAEQALALESSEWSAQPVFVQERVDGTHEARMLLIGENALGARRERVSLDWRTDPSVPWIPWDPDPITIGRCRSFLNRFSLQYGAFDFILNLDAPMEPTFLECNPSGDFGYLDDVLDRKPSSLIGEHLVMLAYDKQR